MISAHWETKGELEAEYVVALGRRSPMFSGMRQVVHDAHGQVTLRRTHGQGLLYDYSGAPPHTYEAWGPTRCHRFNLFHTV